MKPDRLLRSRQGWLKLGQSLLGVRERLKPGLSLRSRQGWLKLGRWPLGVPERLKLLRLLRSHRWPRLHPEDRVDLSPLRPCPRLR